MASSAALTTTHLPRLRSLLDEYNHNQPAPTSFITEDDKPVLSKDVVVAFRTRPPLENEAAEKFKGDDEVDPTLDPDPIQFCPGISVPSAEPGIFIAHVPGMKVCKTLSNYPLRYSCMYDLKWSGPTLTHKQYDADLAFGPETTNEQVYQRTVVSNDVRII